MDYVGFRILPQLQDIKTISMSIGEVWINPHEGVLGTPEP